MTRPEEAKARTIVQAWWERVGMAEDEPFDADDLKLINAIAAALREHGDARASARDAEWISATSHRTSPTPCGYRVASPCTCGAHEALARLHGEANANRRALLAAPGREDAAQRRGEEEGDRG